MMNARISADLPVQYGDQLYLKPKSDKWHLFDRNDEKTLLTSPLDALDKAEEKEREELVVS
jgi:hypothetical protein